LVGKTTFKIGCQNDLILVDKMTFKIGGQNDIKYWLTKCLLILVWISSQITYLAILLYFYKNNYPV